MRYAISIAVHNNLELTRKCLESVFVCSEGQDYVLVVTDNASSDGTREYLELIEKDRSNLIVVKNDRNMGFGVPHNEALALVMGRGYDQKPQYFVVLNNDLEVCGRWLRDMSAALESDPLNAICGIKGTCCGIDKNGIGRPSETPEYVEASCLMIRTDLLEQHDLFSGDYIFAYYEDSDLSLRMRQAGYKLVFVPLPIYHQGAATSKIVADVDLHGFYLRNQKVFLEKWKGYLARRGFGAKTILVVRDVALGDVILTTPVIRALRLKYPTADISMVTRFPEVYKRNPHLTYCGTKILRQLSKYDLFFDLNLAYEKRPIAHIVEAYADVCGVYDLVDVPGGFVPDLYPGEEDVAYADGLLGADPWIAIHPGPTLWPGRNWGAEKFDETAKRLKERGWKIALVGGKDAHQAENDLDLRGKTSFHQLVAVLGKARAFVGIDSAPMHMALAGRTPTFGIFGCIDPAYRLPTRSEYDGIAVGITAPLEEAGCLGCHHYLPAPRVASECFRERTKVPRCMEKLKPESVVDTVEAHVGRPS